MSQMQLLHTPLTVTDVVYTPAWVASDMVQHFQPSGKILEPSAGDGAFLQYLPTAEWCEISNGRDFFDYHSQVDWCIGNPPYGMYLEWIAHSMEIANDIAYLLPASKPLVSFGGIERMRQWGHIKHIRHYAGGRKIGFPFGFAVAAIHFRRNYFGDISMSYFDQWDKVKKTAMAKSDCVDSLPLFGS